MTSESCGAGRLSSVVTKPRGLGRGGRIKLHGSSAWSDLSPVAESLRQEQVGNLRPATGSERCLFQDPTHGCTESQTVPPAGQQRVRARPNRSQIGAKGPLDTGLVIPCSGGSRSHSTT